MRSFLAKSIFPRLNVSTFFNNNNYHANILELIKTGIGGFVLFEGDIDSVYRITQILQNESNGNLIFAADCEDGLTMRFNGATEFPNMWALAQTNDLSVTYSVARSIALEMKAVGLHWNLAPVVDININPNNPIINTRSFGENVEIVCQHSQAYIKAMQDFGIIACAKHFPGHGDTDIDSHSNLPILNFDLDRLYSVELKPFINSIENNVLSIMTAHLAVPSLDSLLLPASLSEEISTNLLRTKLKFDGVVITDALDMHAITNKFSNQEAALLAYTAGADVIETMPDPIDALEGLMTGFRNNKISEERAYKTFERINNLKNWLIEFDKSNINTVFSIKNNLETANIAAQKAIKISTLSTGNKIKIKDNSLILAFTNKQFNSKAEEWINVMFDKLPESYAAIINEEINDEEIQTLIEGIETNETIIIGLFVKPSAFSGMIGLSPKQQILVNNCNEKNTIIMNFGNPYLLKDFQSVIRIDAFSFCNSSISQACKELWINTKIISEKLE